MTLRSKSWNEGLAEDLKNPEFAKAFFIALQDEGFTLREALQKTVQAYGIKEFAKKVGMSSPSLSRAIRPSYNPSQKTLERLLKPFGLRLSAAPAKRRAKGKAA